MDDRDTPSGGRATDPGRPLAETLMETIPLPIFYKDTEGRYLGCNRAFEEMIGQSRDSIVGRLVYQTTSPQLAEASHALDRQLLEEGGEQRYQSQIRLADGRFADVIFAKARFYNPDGTVGGLIGVIQDITERLQAEHALQESERKYRDLVENVNSIILRLDMEGRVTFFNNFAQQFFGFSEAEVLGRLVTETIVPPLDRAGDDLRMMIDSIIREPERYSSNENENVTKDGLRVWVSWTNRAVCDADGRMTGVLCVGNDITARKRLEETLQVYRNAIESSISAIGLADLRGRLTYANPAFLRLYGFADMSEVTDKDISQFMASSDDAVRLVEADLVHGGWRGEAQVQRADGTPIYVGVAANVVRDEHVRPVCLMVSSVDITERKAAEEELLIFKTMSDSANYGLAMSGFDGLFTYANEAFAQMHGYTVEELIGRHYNIVYPESDTEAHAERIRQTIETGSLQAVEIPHLRKDGTIFPALMNMTLLRDATGQPLLGAASTIDITELREATDALTTEKERLSVTLRSIGDGVIATDVAGRVTLLNRAAEQLTGWSQAEAAGHLVGEVFRALDANTRQPLPDLVQQVLGNCETNELRENTLLVTREGVERTVADSAAPIFDHHSDMIGVVLVFRDVTEQQRLQEEVYRAHKLESLGILAGGIAHDFNNLLTVLVGQIDLAKRRSDTRSEVHEDLVGAEKAALRARHLTQQLLTFSTGGAPVRRTLALPLVIQEVANFALSGSAVEADYQLPDDLWAVEADEGQMSQVINNLVINALQVMPVHGTLHLAAANVSEEEKGGLPLGSGRYVRVTVRDEGPGISPDILGRIFDPYFTTKPQGNGLGLTIAYSIVSKHGGFIRATSDAEGASFDFYLPASDRPAPLPLDETPVARGRGGRILVMDDDELIRKVAQAMLRQLGYEVAVAGNGEEALARFSEAQQAGAPFAGAVLDLTVRGGMGGKEVVAALRQLDPQVKALACSGYSNDPIMADCERYGFGGALLKPYRTNDLARALQQLLEGVE
jgi:PAS domain S-box-containing protein